MNCEICSGSTFRDTPYYYNWKNKDFRLVKCVNCGLITQDPKPNAQELEELYAEEYFESGAHGLNMIDTTYEESRDRISMSDLKKIIQERILKFKPDTKSVFEIGFAMGHLLAAAKELGMHVSGIEFSEHAARRAHEKFGLEVIQGNFENIDSTDLNSKWDCIYGGDVFEHFAKPSKVVANMAALLNQNGIIVLVIPSTFNLFSTKIATVIFRLFNKRKRFVDKPYHLFEYTTSTIKKMLSPHFKDIKVINNIKKPSQLNIKTKGIEYKIKYLIHIFNYPYTKLFNRNGDRLLIIARK
jgi:2-polyprenyl-3-methyl-5-hydroxy-6-metoxy-1,4-benzoquinol methylase